MHIIYSNINCYYLEVNSGKPKRNRCICCYVVLGLCIQRFICFEDKSVRNQLLSSRKFLITAEQQSLFLYVSINLKFQAKFCIDVQQQHTGNSIIM